MSASRTAKILDVYWDAERVGQLTQNISGSLHFIYDPDFVHTAPMGISLSLPLQEAAFEDTRVQAFFSGLLPEESVRTRLAQHLGVSDKNTFSLLDAVGGDCAGALAFYPPGETPPTPGVTPNVERLDDAGLTDILDKIKRRPLLAGEDGVRLSLAGAQDKLAVGFQDGHVLLMKGAHPTTHILKPLIDRIADSAYNELFCMRLAKEVGLDVPQAAVHFVNDTPYYLVERYDRVHGPDGTVERVHQEDFCQALGIGPELKYQREGGPSIAHCQQVIAQHVARPAVDRLKFLDQVIFNYLVGNADAHGKNFSLLYRKKKPDLAPVYDVLSTAIYPDLALNMAMKIGGKYNPDHVYLRHWYQLIPDTKVAQTALKKQLASLATRTIDGAATVKKMLEADGLRSSVFADVCALIEERAAKLR